MAYPTRNPSTYGTVEIQPDYLLKEDGDNLLLEDGGLIEIEQLTPDFVLASTRGSSTITTPTRNT